MPVSFFPCFTSLLLIAIPLLFLWLGRKAFLLATAGSSLIVALIVLPIYGPGWTVIDRAKRGDPKAQYDAARWTENHCGQIQQIILWPCESDVLDGYAWLDRAAGQDYPPALWLIGVRLKYGIHVPRPPDWSGPAGNVFPQPQRGQEMIDRAKTLGFHAPGDEEGFYWQVFRK